MCLLHVNRNPPSSSLNKAAQHKGYIFNQMSTSNHDVIAERGSAGQQKNTLNTVVVIFNNITSRAPHPRRGTCPRRAAPRPTAASGRRRTWTTRSCTGWAPACASWGGGGLLATPAAAGRTGSPRPAGWPPAETTDAFNPSDSLFLVAQTPTHITSRSQSTGLKSQTPAGATY